MLDASDRPAHRGNEALAWSWLGACVSRPACLEAVGGPSDIERNGADG
ncbi:hypothetical protein GS535_03945, partial [Saccharibacter sp. EH611]|nr:hypothetical protein [Saccharibacter sp. EH611]